MKSIWKNTAIILLIVSGILKSHPAFAQYEAFTLLDESEVVSVRLEFNGDIVGVFFRNIPADVYQSALIVDNLSRPGFDGVQITGSQLSLELGDNVGYSDTLVVYLRDTRGPFEYPAEYIVLQNDAQELLFGAESYKLRCEPQNDPWMPNAYQPFLFYRNHYYLNPKNGRIIKGKRAVNSGQYTACELEGWVRIYPEAYYYDKNKVRFTGSELIDKRRIKLKDWDLP